MYNPPLTREEKAFLAAALIFAVLFWLVQAWLLYLFIAGSL